MYNFAGAPDSARVRKIRLYNMKKKISVIIFVAVLAALVAGCTTYNKVIKSGDRELMYRTALDYFEKEDYDKTLHLLQEVTYFYQGTAREDTILYYTGMSLYQTLDFDSSEMIFDDFRRRFGRSPFIEDAEYMYAMTFYHRSPRADRDQTYTIEAIRYINEYVQRYPNSIMREQCLTRLDELQNKLYNKEFINARTYYKIGRYKSAVVAFRNALAKYPQTPHREEILYLTTKSAYELAANSIESLQRERFLDVMDSYYTFVAEFPESAHRKDADKIMDVARKYIELHPADEVENKIEI